MTAASTHARFENRWLSLREPVDHASRAGTLTQRAAHWVAKQPAPYRLIDLGSGSGSNVRYLAPRLPGRQYWRLIDHDPALLEYAGDGCRALTDAAGQAIDVALCQADLSDASANTLAAATLVSGTALLDLVTESWIESLVAACAAQQAAVLFTLSVDGCIRCENLASSHRPSNSGDDPDDDFVRAQLAIHQSRDKGFGAALGPRAPALLAGTLEQCGYQVHTAASDWHLDRVHESLAHGLIDGWRNAVVEQTPEARARIEAWARRRRADISTGRLELVVGHQDVFAVPGR